LNKTPHIVFQQKFSSTPGKPEREFGAFPGEINGFESRVKLYRLITFFRLELEIIIYKNVSFHFENRFS